MKIYAGETSPGLTGGYTQFRYDTKTKEFKVRQIGGWASDNPGSPVSETIFTHVQKSEYDAIRAIGGYHAAVNEMFATIDGIATATSEGGKVALLVGSVLIPGPDDAIMAAILSKKGIELICRGGKYFLSKAGKILRSKDEINELLLRAYKGTANQIAQGRLTRSQMSELRNMVRQKSGTDIVFGSSRARHGNFYDRHSNTIHLTSSSRNQPRGMIMEEIQHALDEATDPALNSIKNNLELHAGTFERMADNLDLPLSEAEREAFRAQAEKFLEMATECKD